MIQLIRGFKDILPGEVEVWQHIESVARSLFEDFGFKEIRIPIMEKTELFARSIGEDTDIFHWPEKFRRRMDRILVTDHQDRRRGQRLECACQVVHGLPSRTVDALLRGERPTQLAQGVEGVHSPGLQALDAIDLGALPRPLQRVGRLVDRGGGRGRAEHGGRVLGFPPDGRHLLLHQWKHGVVALDLEAEVVVVGAGACGLTAALRARASGREVVVVERDASPTGSTSMSSSAITRTICSRVTASPSVGPY